MGVRVSIAVLKTAAVGGDGHGGGGHAAAAGAMVEGSMEEVRRKVLDAIEKVRSGRWPPGWPGR